MWEPASSCAVAAASGLQAGAGGALQFLALGPVAQHPVSHEHRALAQTRVADHAPRPCVV
jgi:hypothetical protein